MAPTFVVTYLPMEDYIRSCRMILIIFYCLDCAVFSDVYQMIYIINKRSIALKHINMNVLISRFW